jgi:hypothetical protein
LLSKEEIQICYSDKYSFLKFGLKRILFDACESTGGYETFAAPPTHMLYIITTVVARNQDTFELILQLCTYFTTKTVILHCRLKTLSVQKEKEHWLFRRPELTNENIMWANCIVKFMLNKAVHINHRTLKQIR